MHENEKKMKAIREALATFAIDNLVVSSQSMNHILTKSQSSSVSKGLQLRRMFYGKISK